MFFFGVGTCIFHDNIYTSFIGKHQTFKYVCCYVMQLALTHQPRKLRDYCSKAECSGLAHLADCRCSDSCQLDVLLVIQENFMPAIRACENAGMFEMGDKLFWQMREQTKLVKASWHGDTE